MLDNARTSGDLGALILSMRARIALERAAEPTPPAVASSPPRG